MFRSVINTWTLAAGENGTDATLTTEVDAGSRPPQKAIASVVARTLGKASDEMLDGLAAHFAERSVV